MRKLKRMKMILLVLLFLAGCQKQNSGNIEAEKENVIDVPTQEAPTPEEVPKKEMTEKKDSEASQKITEDGTPKEAWDEVITLTQGKVFGELMEVGTEDAVYCNLPENLNDVPYAEKLLLVCPDPLYGIDYYVDYGGDYLIHAVKDGKGELAVKIPAKRLFCRGGKLYFMVENYNKYTLEGLENGDVLTYDPINGEVSVVLSGFGGEMGVPEKTVMREEIIVEIPEKIAVDDTCMTVYQDGIYYKQKGGWISIGEYVYQPVNNYYYSFKTKETKRINSSDAIFYFVEWGGYLFVWDMGDLDIEEKFAENKLFHIETGEEKALGIAWRVFCVVADNLYTMSTSGVEWAGEGYSYKNAYSDIVVYNLKTEEEKRYRIDKPEDQYSGFFLFNDVMYFSDLYYYSLSEEKGGYAYSSLQNKNDIGFPIVSEFYTDGKQLYGLSVLDGKLYRIEEQNDSYTVPGTDHTYSRRLDFLPIGE